jgi:hypothetical protein
MYASHAQNLFDQNAFRLRRLISFGRGLEHGRDVLPHVLLDRRNAHLFNRDQLAEILRTPHLIDGFEIAVDLIDDATAELNFQRKPFDIFIATIFLP